MQLRLEQTHISWVVIGPHYALKIKKPVKFSFVDFSTLAKRKHFCEEELKLNRRYSPSLYLKVIPLREKGKIVDYAVVMRALPSSNRLDKLLAKHKVTPAIMKELAETIWHFHKRAKTNRHILRYGRPESIYQAYALNYTMIRKFVSRDLYHKIHHFTTRFLAAQRDLFMRRIKQKAIRDLHGDLHPANIFYYKRPYMFDCIEFNPAFRYIDVASEISFLLMELEFISRFDLADILLRTYLEHSPDHEILKLLNFYKCHYAGVRGLVNSILGKNKLAKKYFALAVKYAEQKPALIAIGGVIGTGKSTLAKGLSKTTGAVLLNSDQIRKELTGNLDRRVGFKQGIYTPAFTRKTYRTLLDRAKSNLQAGKNVILDATFSQKSERQKMLQLKRLSRLFFIETTLPDKVILKRLRHRQHNISDATPKLLGPFKKSYETPQELPVIRISTLQNKQSVLRHALAVLNHGTM